MEVNRAFEPYRRMHSSLRPSLYPTLAVLGIVLDADEDLGNIGRTHPRLHEHPYFKPQALFPKNISDLVPPIGNRWWDDLGEH